MNCDKNTIKLRGSKSAWRLPWILGILSLIFYRTADLYFYHFYVYFFIAGIISLYSEWKGWGEINSEGLTIYMGILKLNPIVINWIDIDKITKLQVTKKIIVYGGGRALIPVPVEVDTEPISIVFENEAGTSLIKKMKKNEKNRFGQKIEIGDNDKTILLYIEPIEGQDFFIQAANQYLKQSRISAETTKIKVRSRQFFSIFDILILLFPIIVFIAIQ